MKPEILKPLGENIRSLQDIGVAKDFHSEIMATSNKWNLFNTKEFLYHKRNNQRKPTEWKRIFVSYISNRELIFRILKFF